jgi:hypothetical protein
LQSKRQGTWSAKWLAALLKAKGAKYGIPDSSRRRINDDALRADHSRLPETARMVTTANEEAINMKTLATPVSKEGRHANDEIAALLSIIPGLGHIYKMPL